VSQPTERLDRALAHYLWPAQWLGAPPVAADTALDDVDKVGELSDLVFAKDDLPDGVRVRAFRDGMIVFAIAGDNPVYDDDFLGWSSTLVRLMNAHLACLHSSLPPPGLLFSSVVNIWSTLQAELETGKFRGASTGSSGGVALQLYNAREPAARDYADWRLLRGPLIFVPADRLEASFELLGRLLACPHKPSQTALKYRPALLRAELLQRAKASLLDGDETGALANAWTASEGMLGDLLRRYLDTANERPPERDASGNEIPFVTADRRRFFEGGTWTIRHTIEFLSFVERMPFDLYRATRECSKARNDWMHYEKVPAPEVASRALETAGELFGLLEGVPIQMFGQPAGSA
jgi:hypothetical protein